MGDLQWLRDDGPSQWFARATLAEYHYQTSGSFSPDTIDAVQTGRWLTLEARWQYRGWERHRVVLGGEVQRNFQQSQAVLIAGPAPTAYMTEGGNQRLGLFFNDEWTIADKLRLVLGARADRQLNRQHSVTPRLALWWQPIAELNVKLLDGRAYCEPNAYESQYGDGVSQIGNPALKSEHLRSTELAVDWRARPNLRMAASLYREKVEGLIDQQLQATTGLLQYQNIGRALGQGLELEADFVADGGWRLRGSVSRATTKVSDSGRQLANAPRALAKLHWSAPRPWAGARLGVEALYIGERLTVQGSTLPGLGVANTALRIAPAGGPWTLAARVTSLFDRSYVDPAGTEHVQDSLQRDGRRFQFELAYTF